MAEPPPHGGCQDSHRRFAPIRRLKAGSRNHRFEKHYRHPSRRCIADRQTHGNAAVCLRRVHGTAATRQYYATTEGKGIRNGSHGPPRLLMEFANCAPRFGDRRVGAFIRIISQIIATGCLRFASPAQVADLTELFAEALRQYSWAHLPPLRVYVLEGFRRGARRNLVSYPSIRVCLG